MIKKSFLNSTAFPDAGIYVMRSEHIYLLAACQPIGINGVGAHKHNDWLSFELCVDGKPVIVDPGTYCYTGNMEMRRLFRSTKYHNTVVVDGKEQIEIHNSMFGLVNPHGEVSVLQWETNATRDLLEAEHTGYSRLSEPVVHRRRFVLDKNKNQVEITDMFSGEGEHTVEWHLHLEEGLRCTFQDKRLDISDTGRTLLYLFLTDNFETFKIKRGWVSRAYNSKEEAEVICYYSRCNVAESSLSFIQRLILSF